jgi:hypothetical protein
LCHIKNTFDEVKVLRLVNVTVIDVDCGEAVKVVCAFPVVSVIENEPETETAIVAVAVSPTKAAVDIAVIVQTVGEV